MLDSLESRKNEKLCLFFPHRLLVHNIGPCAWRIPLISSQRNASISCCWRRIQSLTISFVNLTTFLIRSLNEWQRYLQVKLHSRWVGELPVCFYVRQTVTQMDVPMLRYKRISITTTLRLVEEHMHLNEVEYEHHFARDQVKQDLNLLTSDIDTILPKPPSRIRDWMAWWRVCNVLTTILLSRRTVGIICSTISSKHSASLESMVATLPSPFRDWGETSKSDQSWRIVPRVLAVLEGSSFQSKPSSLAYSTMVSLNPSEWFDPWTRPNAHPFKPSSPLPLNILNNIVSAWSEAWWAVAITPSNRDRKPLRASLALLFIWSSQTDSATEYARYTVPWQMSRQRHFVQTLLEIRDQTLPPETRVKAAFWQNIKEHHRVYPSRYANVTLFRHPQLTTLDDAEHTLFKSFLRSSWTLWQVTTDNECGNRSSSWARTR